MLAVIDAGVLWGLLVAIAAAACFELSYALQALEARATERALALRASLLATLARRGRWAGAIALGIFGWGLQIVALSLAPLTVVQPVLAAGLLLLMYLGVRLLGEHVGPRELSAAAAIVAGIAVLALSAPDRATEVSSQAGLAVALGVLVLAAVTPYLLRTLRAAGGLALVVSAGAADATAGVAAKLISDALSRGRLLVSLAWAALAGATVLLGLLSETTALQRLPATRVAPPVLVLQVAVPVLLAPLVFGESWAGTPLGGGLIVAGLAVVGVGTVVLAGSAVIGDFAQAGHVEDERRRGG